MHGPGDVAMFDRFARAYDRVMPPTDERALRSGLALAERDIDRVLDVGGGTGRAARAIDAPERIVVDAAPGMLGAARERGLTGVCADAACLPIRDESIDAVVIVDALHHMADQVGVLDEAARVLAPGGVLVIREFDRASVRGALLVGGEHLVGLESRFFTPDELAARVERTSLRAAVPTRGFGFTVVGRKDGDESGALDGME